MSTSKKLSIGVVSYRFDDTLTQTITSFGSIPQQVEVIVQVAQETEHDHRDFSLKYGSIIESGLIRILSVGDEGIFSAMNRIRHEARGEYLWFINAGDRLLTDLTVDRFLSYLTDPRSYGFRAAQIHAEDTFIRPALRYTNPRPAQIGHVAAIYHRSAYSKIAFNENQPISADRDFTERCFVHSGWQYIPEVIGVFELDGVSTRYRYSDFQAFSDESISLRFKFLIKMVLRLLVGPKWLHRSLLFRKCDRVDSSQYTRHIENSALKNVG